MRIVFFVLVLVVGARFMLTTVPAAVRAVPAELYDGAGLFGLLVDDRGVALTMVEVLRVPVVLAIVLSAVGLGGRLPMLVAGLGSFLMVGAYLSGTGTGHSWYVAIVAMVVLGLTHRPTAWSLDGVLARRWRRYPFGRGERDTSAVGLKLILIYAVFTLFAGGCAKLLEAGWRWMDGESIRYYLIEHGAPKGAIGRRAHRPRPRPRRGSPSSSRCSPSWSSSGRCSRCSPLVCGCSTSPSSPPGSTSPPTC